MKSRFEDLSDPKLRMIAMVWRDLYGNGACTEALARSQPAVDGCTRLWRDLVVTLCEEPVDTGRQGSVKPDMPAGPDG